MDLPPELLEPPRKMLSGPPLGIAARRPRPELVDERLGLGKASIGSVHAFFFRHAVLMPGVGFEPTRPEGQCDFEPIASASSTTRAGRRILGAAAAALRRLRLAAAGVGPVAVGFVARDLDLGVPLLLEAAHREGDQEQLHRDEDEGQQAEDRGLEGRVVEAGLVAVEPCGPATAATTANRIARPAATGSTPRFHLPTKYAIRR